MNNVTLTIAGRAYAVACAEGEEAHVAGLGRMIDGKIAGMAGHQSLGEARALLFAALLLADRVHELEEAAGAAAVEKAGAAAIPVERLAALAGRLERLAGLVENARA